MKAILLIIAIIALGGCGIDQETKENLDKIDKTIKRTHYEAGVICGSYRSQENFMNRYDEVFK